ncbi:EVE domain-containing protein [Candidatus Kapabacteria bacterium]|nr:EVE domain-containing protein [Candidatus Kapabacteria bacterium]
MNYWLIKSDPETYGWDEMKEDQETFWDGVRNYQARNFMKLMEIGDICLFYLSNKEKAICGEVVISKSFYQDPTTDDDKWVAVDVKFKRTYQKLIYLKDIKETEGLEQMHLVKNSRLSVSPVTPSEYKIISNLEAS